MITFIVGTDTDVGKTYYGKKLISEGKKLISEGKKLIKPIETGKETFSDIHLSDCYSYARLQNKSIEEVNLYFFNKAASPHLAAEMDNQRIDIDLLKGFIIENDHSFVECAGGLYVPITRHYTQLDLIKDISKIADVNVDLIVDNRVGCINHACLTIQLLKDNLIPIREIFINNRGKSKDKVMGDNKKIIMDFIKGFQNI
ncbi:MAG: dethiobiotin synthase [Peptostreptococcales bacterium]|jgi:dethiobiotin synthase